MRYKLLNLFLITIKNIMKNYIPLQVIIFSIVLLLSISCKKSSSGSNNNNNNTTGADSATTIYSTTIAGNNSNGNFDSGPTGVVADAQGNIYVAISNDSYIAKITPAGSVTPFVGTKNNAGCEDGTGAAATFTFPYALCMDAQGNIYVADYLCSGIKRISPAGVTTKFCSGDAYNNIFIDPQAICIDPQGNVYSANQLGEEGIIKTTPGGIVSRFAGSDTTGYLDGPQNIAEFNGLGITGLCADGSGNIYVADPPRIRKISNGQVTTIAGNATNGFSNGKGSAATFGGAMGICLGPDGNIYIADVYNNMIRKMTPDGTVTTVTGNGNEGFKDGAANVAQYNQPTNLCFDAKGNLYVADYGNNLVRKITFPK